MPRRRSFSTSLFDTEEEELEAYSINKILHKMIAAVDQSEFGFKLLIKDASGSEGSSSSSSSSSSDDEDDEPSRKKKPRRKSPCCL